MREREGKERGRKIEREGGERVRWREAGREREREREGERERKRERERGERQEEREKERVVGES